MDETLTLVFKILPESPRNPTNSKKRGINYKRRRTGEGKTISLLLVTYLA
jgi:hypothetical protein